ncbi:MAG: universal stress protein [Vicingaceae bacterium]
MNKILFPTDFSENAHHAFRFAKMMARAKKAKLILIYAYNLPLAAPVNAFTSREQTLNLIEQDLRDVAQKHMKVYTDELDLMEDPYDLIIKEGMAVEKIAKFCRKETIDLIVMGTKGQTDHRGFLMGSVTAKLIEKVSIPLLAIPDSVEIRPFRKIVFASDLLFNSSEEIQKAMNFAKLNKSSLTFLHIKTDSEKEENDLSELKHNIKRNRDQNIQVVEILADTVVHGIDTYLQENKTDLLMLCNHTKSFFEKLFHKSISKQMVLHSKVPLLIFSKEIHPIVFF